MEESATQINALLIEDNPDDALLMEAALADARGVSIRVEWVERLAVGMERLSNGSHWDVVLLDLSLPDAHGLETFTRLHRAHPDVAIVVLTGLDDEALSSAALREGAQDYIVKGQTDEDMLLRSIRYAVQRKRGEEAIRRSETRYRTLFEQSKDAIFIAQDGRIVDANQAASDLFAFTPQEVIGLDIGSVFVDPDARIQMRRELAETGSVTDFEAQLKCKGGVVIDCLLTATVQFDEDGSGRRIQGVIRDVTRQKLYEKQLKSSIDEKESLLGDIRQLFEQERRRVEFMGAVNDITLAVSSVLTLDELMGYLPNVLLEAFGYYSVNIFLEEPDSGDWLLTAGANAQNVPVPIGDRVTAEQTSIVGRVGRTGEIVLANDVENDPRYIEAEQTPGTKSELAVPVKTGDMILGVLDIQSGNRDAFDETDQFTAQSLANQLAVSIENARLFEQTRDLAVLEERNRMAREIHDTLAQGFTGVIMQLEAGEQALESRLESEAAEHLERAKALAKDSLQEARRTVWDLLPRALEDQRHLEDALRTEVEQLSSAGQEKVSFATSGVKRELPTQVQTALLRICQEALINVRKHASAANVDVRLDYTGHQVGLMVVDDGVGFNINSAREMSASGGFGMTAMRQRANGINGVFEVMSEVGHGTSISARAPIR